MKYFCVLLLVSAGFKGNLAGQSRVASQVSIALAEEQVPVFPVTTDAIFSLSSSTGLFEAVINLFPIVPNPDIEDSFAIKARPLQLIMKGQFPAGDISFLTTRGNVRKYTMPCACTVYDSTRSCQVNFSLASRYDQPITNVAGSSIYQSALDFVIVIYPRDYGLDAPPFEIAKPILITAKNGIINKTY